MASYNSTLFLSLLVAVSALMAAAPSTAIEITLTPVTTIKDVIIIRGILYCEINVTLSPNGTVLGNPPTFPNAAVLLRCGNTTLANTTTNLLGILNIVLDPLGNPIQDLLNFLVAPSSNCTIVVTTPLASCNATLPSNGTLVSSLTSGTIDNLNGFLRFFIVNLAGFRLFN